MQAFDEAGADVLYAPGLHDLASIRIVCEAVSKPVNVVMGMPGATFFLAELAEAGVKRVSVGSALARTAFGAFVAGAREMANYGTFHFAQDAIGFAALEGYFDAQAQ